jgi:hypothetical protein
LMKNIYRANVKEDKSENIALAREWIEVLKLYLNLWKDLGVIDFKKYADLGLIAESISKQLTAWGKSQKGTPPCPPLSKGMGKKMKD